MKKFYLKLFAFPADFVLFFVVVPVWLLITLETARDVITLLTLVVKENSRKPLMTNITKVFGILVFCKAIDISTINFNELYSITFLNKFSGLNFTEVPNLQHLQLYMYGLTVHIYRHGCMAYCK